MILGSELELKKVKFAESKHLGILPKTRGGGNSAKVESTQPLKKQSLPTWLIGPACSVVVL